MKTITKMPPAEPIDKGISVVGKMAELDFKKATVDVCLLSKDHATKVSQVRRLVMSADLAERFRVVVDGYKTWLTETAPANEVLLRPYTAGYKPDSHEIEYLDLDEYEDVQGYIDLFPQPPANAAIFQPDASFVDDLVMYVVIVQLPAGPRIVFLRKYDAKQEITRSRFFGAWFSNNAYDTVRDPLFLFDSNVDCVAYDGVLLSFNKHNMQTMFAFFEEMTTCAMQCMETINTKVPIAKFDLFSEKCKGQLNKLMKLANIANKPYLKTVTMADLKRTIKKFKLPIKTVMEDGVEKIEFDPKQPWVILKLLDDDYLGSQMTNLQYEVNSKRTVA